MKRSWTISARPNQNGTRSILSCFATFLVHAVRRRDPRDRLCQAAGEVGWDSPGARIGPDGREVALAWRTLSRSITDPEVQVLAAQSETLPSDYDKGRSRLGGESVCLDQAAPR